MLLIIHPVSTLSLNFQLIHKNIQELHTYKNILDLMNSELANSTNIENSFRDFFLKDNNALILLKAKLQNLILISMTSLRKLIFKTNYKVRILSKIKLYHSYLPSMILLEIIK